MKAQELRIGNLLLVDGDFWHVDSIINGKNPELYFVENIEYNHWLNSLPIPLTEEWLLRFGFKNLRHSGEHLFELIYNDVIGYRFSMEGQYGYPEIKYVHQLQNLYFALTGDELKLKKYGKNK